MSRWKEYTGSFIAHDEEGNEVTIEVFTEFHEDVRGNRLEGLKEFRLRNGEYVNRIQKGKYQVVQTGELLYSDDDDAP